MVPVPTALLERDDVLRRLERALGDLGRARGGMTVVEGPAGVGKTAVLGALRAAAETAELRVHRARGALLEREFAFGVVRQLFEQQLAAMVPAVRADVLTGAAGVAAAALGLDGPPGGAPARVDLGPTPSFPMLHGLYWLCANLAARRPLVLVVDDLQWADLPSLRFLAFLLPRLEELPVAVVAGLRTGEPRRDPAATELLELLVTDAGTRMVALAPLSADGVAALAGRRLAADVDPIFAAACHHATGGMPFLVGELAEELAERGIAPTAAAAGQLEGIGATAIGRWMLVRLVRLGQDAGRVARALAVLESGDLGVVAALAGLEASAAARALDALEVATIAAPGRPAQFRHPIVRAAVYGELSPTERQQAHRHAAALLTDPQRAAEHLLAVAPAGDPEVVERLAAVAADVLRRGAPEPAAVYLRRALDEPAPAARRPELLLSCAVAEESVGDARWEPHGAEALALAADAQTRADIAVYLASALARQQRFPEAVDVLEQTLAALEPGAAPTLLVEAAAAAIGAISAATADRVERHLERMRAVAATGRPLPRFVAATAGYAMLRNNSAAADAVAQARRALGDEDGRPPRSTDPPWLIYVVITLIFAGEHAQAEALLTEVIGQAQRVGDGVAFGACAAARALVRVRQGDLRAAEADGLAALRQQGVPVPSFYRVWGASAAVEALVERGRLEEAEDALLTAWALVAEPNSVVIQLMAARARLRVAQGRHAAAIADLREVGGLSVMNGEGGAAHVPWRSELARALLATGATHEAGRLADEEVAIARAFGGARALGLALGAAGLVRGGDEGLALLEQAVALLARADSAVAHARALLDLGAALRRANRRADAREPLRRAMALAEARGAALVAGAAATELRATGARARSAVVSGVASLTASELRVAEHAGRGLTNREIAQALFVTARTVEGHLTSVFRKLDLTSREELADALAPAPALVGHPAGGS